MDDDDATGGMDGEIFFASIPRAARVARGVSDEAERDGNARVSTSTATAPTLTATREPPAAMFSRV